MIQRREIHHRWPSWEATLPQFNTEEAIPTKGSDTDKPKIDYQEFDQWT